MEGRRTTAHRLPYHSCQSMPSFQYLLEHLSSFAVMPPSSLLVLPSVTVPMQKVCPGFGWDRVDFLPSSWYSAVFWI